MTKPRQPDFAKEFEARLWWLGMGAHIAMKLYGPLHVREFWRDRRALGAALYHFRANCRGRGWVIPEADQEKLINKLTNRCKEAIDKSAMDHAYIPGYLGKALSKFVEEIADTAQRKWKPVPSIQHLPPEMLKATIEATMARVVTEKIEAA